MQINISVREAHGLSRKRIQNLPAMWESNALAYTVDDDIVTAGYADQPMYGKVALEASSLNSF